MWQLEVGKGEEGGEGLHAIRIVLSNGSGKVARGHGKSFPQEQRQLHYTTQVFGAISTYLSLCLSRTRCLAAAASSFIIILWYQVAGIYIDLQTV